MRSFPYLQRHFIISAEDCFWSVGARQQLTRSLKRLVLRKCSHSRLTGRYNFALGEMDPCLAQSGHAAFQSEAGGFDVGRQGEIGDVAMSQLRQVAIAS